MMKKFTLTLLLCMAVPLCMFGQGKEYFIQIPDSAMYVAQNDTQYVFCVGSYLIMPELPSISDSAIGYVWTLSTSQLSTTPSISTPSSSSSEVQFYNRIMTSSDSGKYLRLKVIESDNSIRYSNYLQIIAKRSSATIDTIVTCDRFSWHGVTYMQSTTVPVFDTVNRYGCDSTVRLNLTINHSSKEITNAEACDSYTWQITGMTFTASVDAMNIGTNAANCPDSNILHLVIHYSDLSGTESANVCDSYTWNGVTYNTSGSYTYNTQTTHGCDSMCTLGLTIRNSSAATDAHTACDSYTWIDGNTYTSSIITPTVTMTNAAGCDSIITLVLTVNYSSTGDTVAVVCDGFTWWNTNYTISTNATHTVANGNLKGCDSTVTLHLTVKQSTTGTDSIQSCDSLTWINGNIYTASTTSPRVTLTNSVGCDSVVTLNLTVFQTIHRNDSQQACNSYVWPRNNQYYSVSDSTDWVYGGKDNHQCDSIIHLDLTINNSVRTDTNITVCDGMNWYGQQYNSTGEYIHTQAGTGVCTDSVVMHLTVNLSTSGIESVTACDSTVWHGTKYYASTNTPQYYMANGNSKGCDSTVTLHLTLHRGEHQTFNAEVCDSYVWDRTGMTYTNSNTYTHPYTSQDGCPSVDTLHLIVKYSTSSVDVRAVCDSIIWIDGNTYTSTQNATFVVLNSIGCDSTITLNLTVHYSTHNSQNEDVCDQYTWAADGNTYTRSGHYVYNTTDNYGCEVTNVLDLNIRHSSHETIHEAVCESYEWVRGDISHIFTSSTETAISYVNEENCPSVDSLYLTVYGFPIPEVRQLVEKRHKGSANPWMLIYPRNSGEDEYYYQWYRNGIPVNGANKQYFQLPYEKAGDSVIYSVWVAAANFSVCASQSYDTIEFQQYKALNITTFPNPAVDHFDVSVQSDDFEAVQLDVYSETGRLVYSTPMQGNSVNVTEKLASGVYILRVSSKDGKTVTGKVIIGN